MIFGWPRAAFGALCVLVGLAGGLAPGDARAAPSLVIDAATGVVLHAEEATRPWYPASLTKLMTAYVALRAVHEKRLTLDTALLVSVRASRMAPSKMGFRPGTEVTLENALKMIMVKSANDVSVTIAEGVSGSVENFAAEMNQVARALGMRQSNFVNPHGLHHEQHISSAQDMAILARALLAHFPEHAPLYGIGALRLGAQVIPTHNGLLGRYPGADGMKTGFVCASGFNVVASASRNGRRLVAVVMGSPNAKARTLKSMALFENAFAASSWGSRPTLAQLPASQFTEPPNMRPQVCGPNRNRGADEDFAIPIAGMTNQDSGMEQSNAAFFSNQGMGASPALQALASGQLGPRPAFEPVPVYVGRAPGWTGVARQALTDEKPDPAIDNPPRRQRAAKRTGAKPAVVQAAKPAPRPAARPAANSTAKPAARPAPKPAAKPAAKPAPKPAAKPAASSTAKPAPKPPARPALQAAPPPVAR